MSGLDVDVVIDELKQRKMPTEAQIKELCEKATAILGEEDNVQTVQAPVLFLPALQGAKQPAGTHKLEVGAAALLSASSAIVLKRFTIFGPGSTSSLFAETPWT